LPAAGSSSVAWPLTYASVPLLVGLPEPNDADEAALPTPKFVRGGRVERTFRKTPCRLTTYRRRSLLNQAGADLEIDGCPVGISIARIWNDRDFWKRRRYHTDPVEELVQAGARAIVNLSASPFSAGKHHLREQMIGSMARRHQVPIFYVNQYGGNDDLVFDGRSSAFAADGSVIARGRAFAADVVLCDLSRRRIAPADDAVEDEIWHASSSARVTTRASGVRRPAPIRRH
jgi:NAD+ synthase/NAD+ synthase (glutamine-hydrolysing)